MNYLKVQQHLFQFYANALQAYISHSNTSHESIGADAIMDILFSYSIRHTILFNVSVLKTANEMFEMNYEPSIEVQHIHSEHEIPKDTMCVLYRILPGNQYAWVGSSGQLSTYLFSSVDEAKESFRRELIYQWLNIQQIIGLYKRHQMLMTNMDCPLEHRLTNLLLHYMDFQILEDIWDKKEIKLLNLKSIRQFAAGLLDSLHIPNSSSNVEIVIDILQLKTDVDIRALGLGNFYRLCFLFQHIHFPETDIAIFPRFLMCHETYLRHALQQTNPEFEISCEYPGEMMQYFMMLYPYLLFNNELTCENAQHLMMQGRMLSSVLKKHLSLDMNEDFSFSQLKNLRIGQTTYIAILQELTPELRRLFYENTVNIFDTYLKDRNFIQSVFTLKDMHLLLKIEKQSSCWEKESLAWIMILPYERFQNIFGDYSSIVLNHLLRKQGYTRQDPQLLEDRYMILSCILQLNDFLAATNKKKHFLIAPQSLYNAGFWLKMIMFFPHEFALEDLNKHQKYLKYGVLNKVFQSSAFQTIIRQEMMPPQAEKNESAVVAPIPHRKF